VIEATISQLPLASAIIFRVTGTLGKGPPGPPMVTRPVGLSAALDAGTVVSITAVTVSVAPSIIVEGVAVTVAVVGKNAVTSKGADVDGA
jgi:hypothetical protein